MSSDIIYEGSVVARGYQPDPLRWMPGGRFAHVLFWPWATILAFAGAAGLFAGTLVCVYRLLEFFLIVAWLGLTSLV